MKDRVRRSSEWESESGERSLIRAAALPDNATLSSSSGAATLKALTVYYRFWFWLLAGLRRILYRSQILWAKECSLLYIQSSLSTFVSTISIFRSRDSFVCMHGDGDANAQKKIPTYVYPNEER